MAFASKLHSSATKWNPVLHISLRRTSSTPLPKNRWYATSSDIRSTVFRGTTFENRCLRLLEAHLGMVLRRVGGKEDGGVDLSGWWWLPDVDRDIDKFSSSVAQAADGLPFKRIRIIAQCKAEKKKIGPKYVRELEGVVWRYIAQSQKDEAMTTPVVAVFLSESPFTKSTILRAMSSQVPFLLLYVPPLASDASNPENQGSSESTEAPGSCVFNPSLGGSRGLFKGQMEIRWCWFLPNSPSVSSLSSPDRASHSLSPETQSLDSNAASAFSYGAPAMYFRGIRLRGWVPPNLGNFNEET